MPELESAGSVSLAAVAVVLLFAAAMLLGGLAVQPILTKHWHWSDAILVRLAVGINLVGLMGVVLGLTGALARGRSTWLLAALSLLWAGFNWSIVRACGSGCMALARRRPPLVAFLAVSAAAITLGPALSYPTGWDELVYHGVLPQRWLAAGWPEFYPDLPYSGFPSFGEILFWLVAPIERVIAPGLVVWVCWVLGLICVYRLLRRRLRVTTATILTLAFAVSETVLMISQYCYVESILLLDVAALLLALSRPGWRQTRQHAWAQAAVLGILAGGAAAVKLTGYSVLAVPVIWYSVQMCFDRARWRELIGRLGFYLTVAFCVCLPFYFRTWLATGNPFYPYYCDWFTDDVARLEMSRNHHVIGGFRYGLHGVTAFVEAPLLIAFRSENYDGNFGFQMMVFIVLAIIAIVSAGRRSLRPIVLWPFTVALWFYVFWFMTAQQARFAIPCLLALLLLAGIGMRLLTRPLRRLAVLLLVATTLSSIPWGKFDFYCDSWLTVVKKLDHVTYVHFFTNDIHLPLVHAVHSLTSPDAKLLLLYEHRGFYLFRRQLIGTPLFQERLFSPPEKFTDADSVMRVLKQNEITHVVVARFRMGPDVAPGWIDRQQPFLHAIEQCVPQGKLIPRWQSDDYVLLELAK